MKKLSLLFTVLLIPAFLNQAIAEEQKKQSAENMAMIKKFFDETEKEMKHDMKHHKHQMKMDEKKDDAKKEEEKK